MGISTESISFADHRLVITPHSGTHLLLLDKAVSLGQFIEHVDNRPVNVEQIVDCNNPDDLGDYIFSSGDEFIQGPAN